jgi:hypothetical protein
VFWNKPGTALVFLGSTTIAGDHFQFGPFQKATETAYCSACGCVNIQKVTRRGVPGQLQLFTQCVDFNFKLKLRLESNLNRALFCTLKIDVISGEFLGDLNKNGAVALTCPVGGLTNFCRSSFYFPSGPTQTAGSHGVAC